MTDMGYRNAIDLPKATRQRAADEGGDVMELRTQEHYDLMDHFEREYRKAGSYRIDRRFLRESKDQWVKGHIYQHAETNEIFLAYRRGYALSKAICQLEATA